MKVFVTGASGHIGSAVVPDLLAAGHEVVGLARSDSSASALQSAGAEVHRGDLEDLDSLTAGAAAADGVIHLAFDHAAMQSGDFPGAIDTDLRAIGAIGEALEGSDKPFVGTGGTLLLASDLFADRLATEEDVRDGEGRITAENTVVEMAGRGIRSSVVRLSPLVHSDLDRTGFGPILIGFAREKGVAGYLGDGSNRWPAVHTLDAARLYRLALESAPAGSRLHGVADEGVPVREIAESIGRNLGLPTASIAAEDAEEHFSYLAHFLSLDDPTSSDLTRALLDWQPTHPGLIEDLNEGHYFND